MNFKDYLIQYARNELNLIGFMDSPFGPVCLEFLEKCADITGSDPDSMKRVCEILPRLIDRKPLSPISELDFEPETYSENDKNLEILRCTRYPYLYRMPDGRYYDDRAVVFRSSDGNDNDQMHVYQGANSSKQEVTVPYFPVEEVRTLN